MLSQERWSAAEELFLEASELPKGERHTLLSSIADDEVREAVTRMLAADDGPELMQGIVEAAVDAAYRQAPTTDLGPYRAIREIGRGGMGVVYLAARADDHFTKHVAVKVLRGFADPRMEARFRQERQILANLEHPNIARLIDAGVTKQDQPFVVMEFVNGKPLLEWCEQRQTPLRERLRLFNEICGAVHYAHRNLIVHRDLKPANILVSDDGTPKLLDFGIAKLMDDAKGAVQLTQEGECLLTPQYASPEQLLGDRVTTASDVYSLGLILFELVTGRLPFDAPDIRVLAAKLFSEDPPAPSAAVMNGPMPKVEAARRSEELKGDLDTILSKALSKDIPRRYAGAEQLREDIERYLNDLPIHAAKDTWVYYASKFARRHRTSVALLATCLIAIVGLSIGLAVTARRASLQRDAAVMERDKSRELAAFLTELFQSADPDQGHGKEVTARELLDRGASRIESNLQSRPEEKAALLQAMASGFGGLGDHTRAAALIGKSLELQKSNAPGDNAGTASMLAQMSEAHRRLGRFDEAEKIANESVAMYRRLSNTGSLDYAKALLMLAKAVYTKGRWDEATTMYSQIQAIYNRNGRDKSAEAADLELRVGNVLLRKRNPVEAEAHFRRGLAMFLPIHGEFHSEVATAMGNIADAMRAQGRSQESLELRLKVVAIDRKVLGNDHPTLAFSLDNAAATYLDVNRWREAEPLVAEQRRIRLARYGRNHYLVAEDYMKLGWLLHVKGDIPGALKAIDEAIEIFKGLYGLTDYRIVMAYRDKAITRRSVKDYKGMEADGASAVRIARDVKGGERDLVDALIVLADAHWLQGRTGIAEKSLVEATEVISRPSSNDQNTLWRLTSMRSAILLDDKRAAEATASAEESLRIANSVFPAGHPRIALSKSLLAICKDVSGDRGAAAKLFAESMPVVRANSVRLWPGAPEFVEKRYAEFERKSDGE